MDRRDRLDDIIDRAAGALLTPRGDGRAFAFRIVASLEDRRAPRWWAITLPLWQVATAVIAIFAIGAYLTRPVPSPRVPATPNLAIIASPAYVTGTGTRSLVFDAVSATVTRPPMGELVTETEWGVAPMDGPMPLDVGALAIGPIELDAVGVAPLTVPELTVGPLASTETRE